MSNALDEYEKKLSKIKSSAELRKYVTEAKKTAKSQLYALPSHMTQDLESGVTTDLALADEYYKSHNMSKASIIIEHAYDRLNQRVSRINKNSERRKFDKYFNSIEKRAEKYVKQIIKDQDPEEVPWGEDLIKISRKCREAKRT